MSTAAQGPPVAAKQRGNRLLYAMGSLLLAWHTVAMMLAPVPDRNTIVQSFRYLFQPYLSFFGLDTTWDFFSPIGTGHQFRYTIEDAEGKEHTFTPIADVNWLLPERRWYERAFTELMNDPETYGNYFAALYCRKHASLRPVSILLFEMQEERFWPKDHMSGKRPYNPPYVVPNPLMRADCPSDK
jgi:hypothetical protein